MGYQSNVQGGHMLVIEIVVLLVWFTLASVLIALLGGKHCGGGGWWLPVVTTVTFIALTPVAYIVAHSLSVYGLSTTSEADNMSTFLATTASVEPMVWVIATFVWLAFAGLTGYLAPEDGSKDKAHKLAEAAMYIMLSITLPIIVFGVSLHTI